MKASKLVLLGVGNAALAVAEHYKIEQPGVKLFGTTRSAVKVEILRSVGIEPWHDRGAEIAAGELDELLSDADVLISIPPSCSASSSASSPASSPVSADGEAGQSDPQLRYAPHVVQARKLVYISSTAVYGEATGVVDERTACSDSAVAVERRAAEVFWGSRGACVLRAPGLYGPATGLHRRLLAGNYKLPGDGSNYASRIHLEDLARIIEAAFIGAQPGSLYVTGDLRPATHLEVVTWLCRRLDLPMPPSIPLDSPGLHYTLRGNRRVDATKVLSELNVTLKYPTYVEGFSQCLAAI
ncbi:MAG: hypothetical protein JSS83_10450 [Cyanobacteria bacterium SZAS LIN-3]|nr:hypothetical protein [Cyanobacteria bacterium SZAS LIN-3]